jgi:hypothetical protein
MPCPPTFLSHLLSLLFLISAIYYTKYNPDLILENDLYFLHRYEILIRLAANNIGMTYEDTRNQGKTKAEKRKEEVIKSQSPGPKTAEAFRQDANDAKTKEIDT